MQEINLSKESKILLLNDALKGIVDIFLGPFLISYLIKVSSDSIGYLSIYNIIYAITLSVMFLLFGNFVKQNNRMFSFRIGIFTSTIYCLFIILFKENISNYVILIGCAYGFAMGAYHLPHNIILSDLVVDDERTKYFGYRNAVIKLVNIIVPVLLGAMIITSSYEFMAIIVFIICLLQFILSCFLKDNIHNKEKLQIKSYISYTKETKSVKHVYLIDFFKGLTITGGVYSLVVSLMQIMYLKNDLDIGLITSLCSLLALVISILFGKYGNRNHYRKILRISNIILITNLVYLLVSSYDGAIVIYNFITILSVTIFNIIAEIELFNVSNLKVIKEKYKVEFFIAREFFLNLGRILGFIALLMVSIYSSAEVFKIFLIFLTLILVLASYVIISLKKLL